MRSNSCRVRRLPSGRPRQPKRGLAFTLIELLVVISIFVLLLALAVPAFSSMMYSSEQSLAEGSLRVAMGTARNVAAGSPAGQDAAAVFLYDTSSKKASIVICTKAGEINDERPDGTFVVREIFAAAPGVEPIQMTAGWTVRGYAPAKSINDEWYGDGTYPGANSPLRNQGNWVFPETSFYDDTREDDGASRQTFMVRFQGGTGHVLTSDPREVLVLSPSESVSFRNTWPNMPQPAGLGNVTPPWDQLINNPLNVTHETDPVRFVKRVLNWPEPNPTYSSSDPGNPQPITPAVKRQILGDFSVDTILTRPVGQLALCNEQKLATGIGVRVDRDSGCIYQYVDDPVFVDRNGSPFTIADIDRLNEWIEGRLLDTNGDEVESDCRVFTLQRYLGWLQEVTGTRQGLGVGS